MQLIIQKEEMAEGEASMENPETSSSEVSEPEEPKTADESSDTSLAEAKDTKEQKQTPAAAATRSEPSAEAEGLNKKTIKKRTTTSTPAAKEAEGLKKKTTADFRNSGIKQLLNRKEQAMSLYFCKKIFYIYVSLQ